MVPANLPVQVVTFDCKLTSSFVRTFSANGDFLMVVSAKGSRQVADLTVAKGLDSAL